MVSFKRKYALSDKGIANMRKGAFWTVIVNFVVMAGVGILYVLMQNLMQTQTENVSLPRLSHFVIMIAAFAAVSLVTHIQQYKATYGLVYGEVKDMRISLAERLRKLPLAFFAHKDLADLTETIMGDVNRMEHVWSHVLGYLYGSYISTSLIALMLLFFDWRMTIASLWGVPVAFALLFGSRKLAEKNAATTKAATLAVSDEMQETIENIRDIHATNQEDTFLSALFSKIDNQEKTIIHGELSTGIFVNAASVIMRLGVATTVLLGTTLILSGDYDALYVPYAHYQSLRTV